MKARVKATGMIVEVTYSHTSQDKGYDIIWYITPQRDCFSKEELEFIDTGESLDYWTRLEHQAAIAAMQGLMSNIKQITPTMGHSYRDEIVGISLEVARTLVEKMKEEK